MGNCSSGAKTNSEDQQLLSRELIDDLFTDILSQNFINNLIISKNRILIYKTLNKFNWNEEYFDYAYQLAFSSLDQYIPKSLKQQKVYSLILETRIKDKVKQCFLMYAIRLLKYIIEGILILRSEEQDDWWKWYFLNPPKAIENIVLAQFNYTKVDELYSFKVWYSYTYIQLDEKRNRIPIQNKKNQEYVQSEVNEHYINSLKLVKSYLDSLYNQQNYNIQDTNNLSYQLVRQEVQLYLFELYDYQIGVLQLEKEIKQDHMAVKMNFYE